MPAGARRRGRECALQLLYQIEHEPGSDVGAASARYFDHLAGGQDGPTPPEVRAFAERIVRGVTERREEIDRRIERASDHWRLARMARVDRNVLRVAVWEMLSGEVPAAVAIDEAVGIARAFGAEESASFVNGVLDRVARDLRGEADAEPT